MASETLAPGRVPFAPYHKRDRDLFLAYLALIWLGIVMGFGGDLVRHFRIHEAPYPWIVHVHAAAFVGWLAMLTTQVLLIRRRRADLHARLGLAAMALAAIMVVIGPATALHMAKIHLGTPQSDPAFLSVQLTDITAFATLAAAGFLMRGNSPAHKRLMLLATLYIADAGYARWLGDTMGGLTSAPFWSMLAGAYLPVDLLILGLGGYDLATRGRLHPAYLLAVPWIAALQLTAATLYFSPAWKSVALALIGK